MFNYKGNCMTYSLATLKYLRRNFFKSFGMTILPAILLGIFAPPLSMLDVIVSIGRKEHTYTSFIGIFKTINYVDNPLRFVFIILVVIVSVLFLSLLVGSTKQRMRYGSYMSGKTRNFLGHINDNFLPVFKYTLVLFISLEVVSVLLSTFLYTSIKLFSNALPACVISAIVFMIGEFAFLAMTGLTIPNMTMKGYGISKAMGLSVYELSARSLRIFFAILWVALIFATPLVLMVIFPFRYMSLLISVFSVLFYWVIITYVCVLMYVVYFDVEEIEREDLKGE